MRVQHLRDGVGGRGAVDHALQRDKIQRDPVRAGPVGQAVAGHQPHAIGAGQELHQGFGAVRTAFDQGRAPRPQPVRRQVQRGDAAALA
ncbi:hypothetical protein D3C71_1412200 [compost metagenome]